MKLKWQQVRYGVTYLWVRHNFEGRIMAVVSKNRVHFHGKLAGSPGDKTRFSSMEEAMKYAETVVRMEYT